MARLRRDLMPAAPSLTLPEDLARFVFDDWAPQRDSAVPSTPQEIFDAYMIAISEWGAAIRAWASDNGLTAREARAMVTDPPNWNAFARGMALRIGV